MEKLAEATRQLARLQAVELERTRIGTALKALPSEVAAAEIQLQTAGKRVTDAVAALKREELLRSSLELEAATLRAKADRHRSQLDMAQNATQASALEHEINFASAEISRLEDRELASMEATERLEAERVKAQELSAKLNETVALIRARVGEQDLEYREQLTHYKLERDTLRAQVFAFDDGARLAHFDRIANAKGTGVAKSLAQQCSGCRMGIRPQVWNQLRDGAVLPCESCSRILYYDPAMTSDIAPSKLPRSISPDTSLAGSSIRLTQAGS